MSQLSRPDFALFNGGDESLPARERAYRYLRQTIIGGQLAAGTRVVEERIAEDLQISRTPVREALQRLRSEGLLVQVRRGQLEAVGVSEHAREELHQLRVAIDGVVARLLARKKDQIAWPQLYARLDQLSDAVTTYGVDSPTYAMAHLEFHMAINAAAFAPELGHLLDSGSRLYAADDYLQQPGYEPVQQHRDLLAQLSNGDEELAVHAALAHAMRGRPDSGQESTS